MSILNTHLLWLRPRQVDVPQAFRRPACTAGIFPIITNQKD